MQRFRFIANILALIGLWSVGNAFAEQTEAAEADAAEANCETSVDEKESPLADVPIVYSSFRTPPKLGKDRLNEIAMLLDRFGEPGDRIWFFYVRANEAKGYKVDVYYQPDEKRGRVFVGEKARLNGGFAIELRIREAFENPTDEQRAHPGWQRQKAYLDDHPQKLNHRSYTYFATDAPAYDDQAKQADEQIENAEPQQITLEEPPAEIDMPFSRSEKLTEEQVVRFIKAAREALLADGRSSDAEQPVLSVMLNDEGDVEIYFGWHQDSLSGRGKRVVIELNGDEIIDARVGFWVS